MGNIIYRSDSIIPWDTQSAFKMTSYNASCEENMVFSYLKCYVHHGDLVLCSYCFTEKPADFSNMHIYINLCPDKSTDVLCIDYGFGGIEKAQLKNKELSGLLSYSSFRTDDEQGFYWCGEIRIPAAFTQEYAGISLGEKSIVAINMVQNFTGGNYAVLFGNAEEKNYIPENNMDVFVILNY